MVVGVELFSILTLSSGPDTTCHPSERSTLSWPQWFLPGAHYAALGPLTALGQGVSHAQRLQTSQEPCLVLDSAEPFSGGEVSEGKDLDLGPIRTPH